MYDACNVLGIKNPGIAKLDAKIRKGFSFQMARRLQSLLAMTDDEVAWHLGISKSAFRRLKKGGKLSRISSDRLYRLAYLFAWAADVLHSKENARKWLTSPHLLFDEHTPLRVAETEPGSREVENMLGKIRYGLPV